MRGQSALEFLSVYAWTFIIIAIFVSVVSIVVVATSSTTYTPSYCYISPQFACDSFLIAKSGSSSNAIVVFTNNIGVSINFPSQNAFAVLPTISNTVYYGTCTPDVAGASTTVTCLAQMPGFKEPIGSQMFPRFIISYKICNNVSCLNSQNLPVYNESGTADISFAPQQTTTSTTSTSTTSTSTSTSTTTVNPCSIGTNSMLITSYQSFTVPDSQSSVSYTMYGGGGGGGAGSNNGIGGSEVTGSFSITSGQSLTVYVGAGGGAGDYGGTGEGGGGGGSGYYGGGGGTGGSEGCGYASGGGGGSSAILIGSTLESYADGGAGGGYGCGVSAPYGGGAGTQSSGGTGGNSNCGGAGINGASAAGGNGGENGGYGGSGSSGGAGGASGYGGGGGGGYGGAGGDGNSASGGSGTGGTGAGGAAYYTPSTCGGAGGPGYGGEGGEVVLSWPGSTCPI